MSEKNGADKAKKNGPSELEARLERRFVPLSGGGVEIRQDGEDGPAGIVGRVNTYGTITDLGPFTEEVAPGFFDSITGDDVRGLFNHDVNYVLGRSTSGTLKLTPAATGLDYEIPALPKSRADVAEAIERRDVDGNSFSFAMPPNQEGEEWIEDGPRGKWHRILQRAARFFDVGPVTFPAYETGTSVIGRSADAVFAEFRSGRNRGVVSISEETFTSGPFSVTYKYSPPNEVTPPGSREELSGDPPPPQSEEEVTPDDAGNGSDPAVELDLMKRRQALAELEG